MFNPIKLATFIYQAGFQGKGAVPVKLAVRTVKSCASLYFKIMKL